MKKLSSSFLIISILLAGIFISCKKESSLNGNQPPDSSERSRPPGKGKPLPPVANAGIDWTMFLPTNSVALNGSASTDPNNDISSYLWTKISGPSSFTISNATAVQTQVTNLIAGVYQFELKVTDAKGLIDKDTVQVTVNPEGSPPPPCTTNCGKIVFVSDRDGNHEIYSCNADGSNITRLTNTPTDYEAWPAWSPDGTRIAFIRDYNLFIMNADGSNVVQKTFENDVAEYPDWSPDGTRIAFGDLSGIVMIDLTNDAISYVPNTWTTDWVDPSPAWSPDGTKIAFMSDMDYPNFGYVDLFTISRQGSGLTNLTPNISGDYNYLYPSWSPDGTKLSVSISQYLYISSIAVMNADGTGLAIIKTGAGGRTSWSPDGTRIAYSDGSINWVAANGSSGGTIVTNGWDADWQH